MQLNFPPQLRGSPGLLQNRRTFSTCQANATDITLVWSVSSSPSAVTPASQLPPAPWPSIGLGVPSQRIADGVGRGVTGSGVIGWTQLRLFFKSNKIVSYICRQKMWKAPVWTQSDRKLHIFYE